MCLPTFFSSWLWYQYVVNSKNKEDTRIKQLWSSVTLDQLKLSPGHRNLLNYQSEPDTGALFAPRVLGSNDPVANKRCYPDDREVTASSRAQGKVMQAWLELFCEF